MLDRAGFAALTHIYDAATDLGQWRKALDAVAASVDAKAIALRVRTKDPKARNIQLLNTTYLDFARSGSGKYYGAWLSRFQDPDWDYLSRQPVHVPAPDTGIGVPTPELDERKDYAFLRKHIGVGRRLGVRLNSDKAWFDAMSIAFDAEKNLVPRSAFEKTGLLLPHVTKAVEINRTFAQLKVRNKAVLTILDRVKVGLAVADPKGHIIELNEETRRILDLADGLKLTEQSLFRCDDPDQTAQLAAAIVEASDTARGEADRPQNLMALKRRSGASPILIDVAPLKDSRADLDGVLEGAMITIIDPDRVPYLRMDRFVALYRLSPAEAEVCELIVQGRSIEEIAERRSTSPVTAKNQVAAILGKTGVGRRADLIRLVIRVLPPVV